MQINKKEVFVMKGKTEKFCIAWMSFNNEEDGIEFINQLARIQLRQAKRIGLTVTAEIDNDESKVYYFITGKKAKEKFVQSIAESEIEDLF